MDNSSSTSSSRPPLGGGSLEQGRPLGTLWLAVVILLGLVAVEAWVRRSYQAPTRFRELVDDYLEERGGLGPHVVVFGTCEGMVIDGAEVESAWGGGQRVLNLSSEGSTPLDWYLVVSRFFGDEPRPQAIVVAFTGNELLQTPQPWSSQTLELAAWHDLPSIVREGCATPSCAIELALRDTLSSYRYRAFLGNRIWRRLGVAPPQVGGHFRPRTDGREPGLSDWEPPAPSGAQGAGQPTVAAPAPGSAAHPPGGPVPALASSPQAGAMNLGWRQESGWLSPPTDPYRWPWLIIDAGRDLGIPVLLYPMPQDTSDPDRFTGFVGWQDPKERARIEAWIRDSGGELLDGGSSDREGLSRGLGRLLRERWPRP
jgi:hypothetical protein